MLCSARIVSLLPVFVMTVLFNQGLTILLICLFDASLLSHLYMCLSASVMTVLFVVC